MLLLSANEIREWDRYTIEHEPITSIELMERAAAACTRWISKMYTPETAVSIFCGKGNNGGDGLAIARQLATLGHEVQVYILEFGKTGSADFQRNLQRLHEVPLIGLHFIQSAEQFPTIDPTTLVVDALFGTGLKGPLEGLTAELIRHINNAPAPVLSIDLPSGLPADGPLQGMVAIRADTTLSFQAWKLALLAQENAPYLGEVVVLDIGLHPAYPQGLELHQHLLDRPFIRAAYRPRNRFAHKGEFGHALLAAGSKGKMGAAVLAAAACMRSGVGLLTCLAPECGSDILQTTVPEAMVQTLGAEQLEGTYENNRGYAAIGVGPGLGTDVGTALFLKALLRAVTAPMVIDADALNLIAGEPALLNDVPEGSILTPHPKEFDRLFGAHGSSFARFARAAEMAAEKKLVIVLKGHHTLVATPGGHRYFNTTGNAGMAKGGSGDVLTGILTALLAQGYDPVTAALLGVYLHGRAGDLAARDLALESMTAMDLVRYLSAAFRELSHTDTHSSI